MNITLISTVCVSPLGIKNTSKNEVYVLADVVHEFVVTAGDVDLADDAGLQTVHQLAQDDAVAEGVLVRHVRKPLADHSLDPSLGFLLLFWLTLAGALER